MEVGRWKLRSSRRSAEVVDLALVVKARQKGRSQVKGMVQINGDLGMKVNSRVVYLVLTRLKMQARVAQDVGYLVGVLAEVKTRHSTLLRVRVQAVARVNPSSLSQEQVKPHSA